MPWIMKALSLSTEVRQRFREEVWSLREVHMQIDNVIYIVTKVLRMHINAAAAAWRTSLQVRNNGVSFIGSDTNITQADKL